MSPRLAKRGVESRDPGSGARARPAWRLRHPRAVTLAVASPRPASVSPLRKLEEGDAGALAAGVNRFSVC